MSTIDRVKEESRELRREVRERTIGYIAGALGLVAGLAWNDAIKALIEEFFPAAKNGLIAKFGYAIVVTVVIVVVTVYLVRLTKPKENQ